MLAKQPHLPGRRRRGGHRPGRAGADRPDQPGRLGAPRLASAAVMALVAPRRGRRPWRRGGDAMADAILVLNAGSSSLKFSVFVDGGARALAPRPDRGLFTTPRFVAKDADGERVGATPGPRARAWATRGRSSTWSPSCASTGAGTSCARWAIAWCTAGSITRGRCASTAGCSPRWRSWSRSRRCTSRITSRRFARCWRHARAAAGGVLRHRVPPLAAWLRRRSRCRPRSPSAACAATASTACPTPTSPRCCPGTTRAPRPGAPWSLHLGNGASMCALKAGASVASTMGFTAVDGLPMGTRCGSIDPGVILYLMDERGMDARASRS